MARAGARRRERRAHGIASIGSVGARANWRLTVEQTWPEWPGMNIQLDRSRPVPLARQIEEHIERLIQERLLAPGVKLPATRELAGTPRGEPGHGGAGLRGAGGRRAGARARRAGHVRDRRPEAARDRRRPGRGAHRLVRALLAQRADHRRGRGAPAGRRRAGDARRRRRVLRGRHARQRALSHRRLPARAERRHPRRGGSAPPVLPGGRLPAAAPVPRAYLLRAASRRGPRRSSS